MVFEVVFNRSAYKTLESLPRNVQERVYAKLKLIEVSPFEYLESFEGDYYKLRIGDYRALIEVDFDKRIIFVRELDKRERIYR